MSECVYKTHEGYCSLHSGSDVREYCVEGPCDDETQGEVENDYDSEEKHRRREQAASD